MATDTRPVTLTSIHNYNLRNQGWPRTLSCIGREDGDTDPVQTDPVTYTRAKVGFYPSDADIVHSAKTANAEKPESVGTYSPWVLRQALFGNSPSGKGHFIINAFNRNRQAVSDIDGIYDPEIDKDVDRPVSVAFYSGRIWYLMPDGRVYFTQTLTTLAKANKCYQDADPTAEDINELVATDGGKIDVTGISQGLKLIPIRAEMSILADNGVWSISGSGEEGFTATNQEIRNVTDVGAIGTETVVEAEGTIFYWSEGGIYVLVPDEVTGQLTAQNITQTTIQTLYLSIPEVAKINARGFYDKKSKKIIWFYNDTAGYDGVTFKNKYNRALLFDTVLNAFYTYTMDSSGNFPFVSSMVQKKAGTFSSSEEDVTDSAVTVTDGGVTVTATITIKSTADIKLKMLTFSETSTDTWQYTFSEFRDETMVDWKNFDTVGVSYNSFAETGHDIVGDLISDKEANSVYTFFARTEQNIISNGMAGLAFDFPSSCLLQGKWQWSDNELSGRWSESKEAYRLKRHYIPDGTGVFNYGFEVIQTINQIRGHGRALSLRFDSTAGKDFHLLGWAIPYTAMTGA